MSERDFLVVYDYGMGGVWGYARAQSEREIIEAFPELEIVREAPEWMTEGHERNLRAVSSFAIAHPSTYPEWLRILAAERDASQ